MHESEDKQGRITSRTPRKGLGLVTDNGTPDGMIISRQPPTPVVYCASHDKKFQCVQTMVLFVTHGEAHTDVAARGGECGIDGWQFFLLD